MCKHSNILSEQECAYCNGSYNKKTQERAKYVKHLAHIEYNTKRKELQEESKGFAYRHKEPYTDGELKHIIVNTFERNKKDLDILYTLAKTLKRRLGAIEWVYNFIWDDRKDEYIKECGLKDRIEGLRLSLGY